MLMIMKKRRAERGKLGRIGEGRRRKEEEDEEEVEEEKIEEKR